MDIDWERVKTEAVEILSKYVQIETTNPPGKELAGAIFCRS